MSKNKEKHNVKPANEKPADIHYVYYGQAFSSLSEFDIFLFKQGTHYSLYNKMGAQHHIVPDGTEGVPDGTEGIAFSVWAPNAQEVSIIGNFNGWNPGSHQLKMRWDGSGIWEGFIPGLKKWDLYKFHIKDSHGVYKDKMDPFSRAFELPPRTASIVHWSEYQWGDSDWMSHRKERNSLESPWAVYEVHLGSWRRHYDDYSSLSYRELAKELPEYCKEMGFTAVELLPVMEHPFYGSWGYQMEGYFAPTGRYGTPEDFMALVDALHQNNIAVILDWVPSHFPTDDYGLARYDGTALYEHEDPKKGFHPEWGSYIFNYSRNEVRSFLISSAAFWVEQYHADGLRVDAVASMLYLDYARKAGEWVPNVYGGRENLDAIALLRDMNKEIYGRFNGEVQTIAEESTDWPMVTRPVFLGGLGFGMKWNMGWMHDTLDYMALDGVYRSWHHDQLTFSIWYAFSENFMLPLSHDEVVHGKCSMMNKMAGDWWQKRANLRLTYGYMWAHPGKKLLFMGSEFGQGLEWNNDRELEWHLLGNEDFRGIQRWVRDLNHALVKYPALHEIDFGREGFEWVDCSDWQQSVLVWLRKGKKEGDYILVAANFTPVPRHGYRVGVPVGGRWDEVLNSDSPIYGGSGVGNCGGFEADKIESHGRPYSLLLELPPLGIVMFTCSTTVTTEQN